MLNQHLLKDSKYEFLKTTSLDNNTVLPDELGPHNIERIGSFGTTSL